MLRWGVTAIQASETAFAAIRRDGRVPLRLLKDVFSSKVVTWGHPDWDGDSAAVQDQLKMLAVVFIRRSFPQKKT